MELLADILWRSLINDPFLWAWAIVFAHLSASFLCAAAAKRERSESAPWDYRSQYFWLVLAVFMFALGVNKRLDLQSVLTRYLRSMSRSEGWYEHRRVYQEIFIGCCLWMGLLGVFVGVWIIKGRWRRYGLAFLGAIFLATFVTIRAASFHHVDLILYGLPYVGNLVNAFLEMGGSILICVAAWRAWSARPRSEAASLGER